MADKLDEVGLAALAKKARQSAHKTKSDAARELKVTRAAIHFAEEEPIRSMSLLRRRIIEKYSEYRVEGPVYLVTKQ